MSKKPILVTGIHRSGSTLTGKILSLQRGVGYLQEPFNKTYGLTVFDTYFKYLTKDTVSAAIKKALDDLIYLREATYKISSEATFDKSLANRRELLLEMLENLSLGNFIDYTGKFLFRSKGQLQFYLAKYNPSVNRILLKDPIACLASQYLHRTYDMDVVVLVRHPLSFVASLKRLKWRFDFNNFLNQQKLMEDHLHPYRDEMLEMNSKDHSFIEQGCLLWNCIYEVLSDYVNDNPSFIVCKHEEIAQHPVESFKMLYSKLGLNYTRHVEQQILDYTSAKNPVEAKNNKIHHLKRNSSQITERWKEILSKDEIRLIREKTEQVAGVFYSEA